MITEFAKLIKAEEMGVTVEIKMNGVEVYGVATPIGNNAVKVYYGKDDGSDDKIISAEEFNKNWQVTGSLLEVE